MVGLRLIKTNSSSSRLIWADLIVHSAEYVEKVETQTPLSSKTVNFKKPFDRENLGCSSKPPDQVSQSGVHLLQRHQDGLNTTK